METTTDEIADGIHRLSTYVPEADLMFNQYLVEADEPLLFHTGPRRLFPLVSRAVARIMPLERLQWISFGHYESDECGSMNDWLAVAPGATIAHTAIGCLVSINDMADREPRPLQHGEIIDLGGKQVRHLSTPHVPHGWDAGLLFEESTATLFCGDLFTATGTSSAITSDDIVTCARWRATRTSTGNSGRRHGRGPRPLRPSRVRRPNRFPVRYRRPSWSRCTSPSRS
jgi:flavorubredoxin